MNLRTPLIGILGFADILKDEMLDIEHLQMMDMIYSSGNRLLGTLNLILDMSKIESDQLTLASNDFDTIKVVKEVIELFKIQPIKKVYSLN